MTTDYYIFNHLFQIVLLFKYSSQPGILRLGLTLCNDYNIIFFKFIHNILIMYIFLPIRNILLFCTRPVQILLLIFFLI